jgi:hypothetical protein
VESRKGRKPLGRPRRRWVDNIKIDPKEIGWSDKDWIYLAQDGDKWKALVNTVLKFRVPQYVGKFLRSCIISGFSRRAQWSCYEIMLYMSSEMPFKFEFHI